MTKEERDKILEAWSGTATTYPRDASIPELFEAEALAKPEAVALSFCGVVVTYGDLNARANRLARYLKTRGVRKESPVGICMERSIELVTAILAILKAGGAYVPLDPSYPEARIKLMIADSGVAPVLVDEACMGSLPEATAELLRLDAEADAIAAESPENLDEFPGAEDLAYILYTSGSTGRPKGVCVEQRSVVRLVKNTNYANFGPDEVFLLFAPTSFDLSTLELWGPLLNGGRLAIAPPGPLSLAELGQCIVAEGVTTLWLTAGLFHLMVDHELDALRGLRQLLAGGDVLSAPHVRRCLESFENTTLINGYGPTESTTFATCYPMRKGDVVGESVPIGRPISNTTVYILDEEMALVPVGTAGELYIGSDGLAREYLNDLALTQERFVRHPFSDEAGARLYRTGDMVRWMASGDIEFIGRVDLQVKLRGYRIELGEVERTMGQLPGLREAVVVLQQDEAGDKRLSAFVVPEKEAAASQAALKTMLVKRVPAYMVPDSIVFLEALPLTTNGKVDRKALSARRYVQEREAGAMTLPRDETESRLYEIWKLLLGAEELGVHDSFFALGAHSLTVTRLLSRIYEAWGVRLALRVVYDEPTIAGLAARIGDACDTEQAPGLPPLVPTQLEGAPTLSFAQQRLWFLEQLNPGLRAYNCAFVLRLRGALDTALLERCLDEIVVRHEALRTTYSKLGELPVQEIRPASAVPWERIDLRDDPDAAQTAQSSIESSTCEAFDLAEGPLVRAQLFELDAEEHVVGLHVHHIAFDGWSLQVLVEELGALYDAYAKGAATPLDDLRVQYKDYAVWERQCFEAGHWERDLVYWRERLAGAPEALELPVDHSYPPAPSFRGATLVRRISETLSESLRTLSRNTGVTLNTTIMAAWKTLLHRYSGQEDIVIGATAAGREQAALAGLIGFFVNTVAVRTDFSGAPTFLEVMQREHAAALAAYEHQGYPFDRLVAALDVSRASNRAPLIQVLFAGQDVSASATKMGDVQLSVEDAYNDTAKFDLNLSFYDRKEGLSFALEYSADLFEESTIVHMLDCFACLLADAVATPERPVGALNLIRPEERARLVAWNDTTEVFPSDARVHDFFSAQVHATPAAPAAEIAGESISYSALDARANGIAAALQENRVGPNVLVGVFLERSFDMLAAVLGILRAGGAYLPLATDYPPERIALMLADAQAPVLLTSKTLTARLPHSDAELLYVDEIPSAETFDAPQICETDLAYVLYTSGSTGRPKGVAMPHRALTNLIYWQQARSKAGPGSKTLQFAALSFDVSFQEIFSTWATGGNLVLVDQDTRMDMAALLRLIDEAGVARVFLPFVALEHLAAVAVERGIFPSALQEVITAGEQLRITKSLRRFFAAMPNCRLDNHYGPTEAHVVSAFALEGPPGDWPELPPIGKPIANVTLHILDGNLEPLPVGVRGDLYIGGAALAQGYLRRPDLSAERFVPNPDAASPWPVLYRTGDLARYLPTGDIEYLGRSDGQLKIRGYRVELGEVEAALGAHPGIREVAVAPQTSGVDGELADAAQHLVAYVVPEADGAHEDLSPEALRSYLADRLPPFMVPPYYVTIECLPLTPSGKVDRRALAKLATRPLAADEYVEAETPVEEAIAQIWMTLLGMKRVGIRDNFFVLGGHSLLAVQVTSRIRDAFQIDLPVSMIFDAPTIEALSLVIEEMVLAEIEGMTDG